MPKDLIEKLEKTPVGDNVYIGFPPNQDFTTRRVRVEVGETKDKVFYKELTGDAFDPEEEIDIKTHDRGFDAYLTGKWLTEEEYNQDSK